MSDCIREQCCLLIGDSLTQFGMEKDGWVHSMTRLYSAKLDVISRGVSGYNTSMVLHPANKGIFFPSHVLCCDESRPGPMFVVVWLGANDAAFKETCPGQHIPLDKFKENMTHIIDELTKKYAVDHKRIILVTPPPVGDKMYTEYCKKEHDSAVQRSSERTAKYAAIVRDLAKAREFNLFDAWEEIQKLRKAMKDDQVYVDGLHLTLLSQKIILRGLRKVLHKMGVDWDSLPFFLPNWRDAKAIE
ncbi:Isoamyl acetate-hydrolyzing esterase Iah1-like protein [Aduncisulcus paluster]|uniref:Isoamyl acetate-hydrolyzing esterase Iah1-like protein n=1 Tax=Aduncisulcus paluster TaxID=2918883 RepID=A0ABQ5KEP8_9EUKA|nr:Isoamyl acetate-hydrolyzing esterase Iah1-like protein [Aduncisulcus paluster]